MDGDGKADVGGADDSTKVVLVSMEGDRFEVPLKVAQMSDLVKTMVDPDELEEDDEDDHEVPLVNVKRHVLQKVIEYCNHHVDSPPKEITKPLTSSDLSVLVSEWDSKFVAVDQELLFELILAANYMDIKPLLDLTCAKVASMIKGKTPEEIRRTFNIENDFTPDEENQVREENKWCEDS